MYFKYIQFQYCPSLICGMNQTNAVHGGLTSDVKDLPISWCQIPQHPCRGLESMAQEVKAVLETKGGPTQQ